VDRILNNVERATGRSNRELPPLVHDGRAVLTDAKKVTGALAADDQLERYRQITRDVGDASANLKGAAADAKGVVLDAGTWWAESSVARELWGPSSWTRRSTTDLQELLRDLKHNPWKFFWRNDSRTAGLGTAKQCAGSRPALEPVPPPARPERHQGGFFDQGCLAKGRVDPTGAPDWSIFRRNQGPRRPARNVGRWGTLLLGQYPELVYISRTLRLRNPLRIAMRKRGFRLGELARGHPPENRYANRRKLRSLLAQGADEPRRGTGFKTEEAEKEARARAEAERRAARSAREAEEERLRAEEEARRTEEAAPPRGIPPA